MQRYSARQQPPSPSAPSSPTSIRSPPPIRRRQPPAGSAPAPVVTVGGVKPEPPTAAELEELKKPMKPLERVAAAPKGTLKNPYTDNPEAIEQGKKLYFGKSCNGCHGGGGGGGMCPPLTNTVWVYGDTDDTLFRLISLGSRTSSRRRLLAQGHRERRRPDAAVRRADR